MRILIALCALACMVGCVPIIAGSVAGGAAARAEIRESGALDDSGAQMVGLTIADDLTVQAVQGEAAQMGLRKGDLIVEIDGYLIEHRQQALNRLYGRAGRKVWVDVKRGEEVLTFRLERWCMPELGCAQTAASKATRKPTDPGWSPAP